MKVRLFAKKRTDREISFDNFFKNVLGFKPRHRELYELAFRHRSNSKELATGVKVNNERLEYLGDAVLSSVVADFLFRKYPYQEEGFLTEMRSKIVSRNNLNKIAKKIGLTDLVSFKGSQSTFKFINGDAFEAMIGAIYLDRGYEFVRKVVVDRIINTYMDIDTLANSDWNYKSKLIDWGQHNHKKVSFEVVNVIDCGYCKQYESRVLIDGEPHESAIDFSIKASEQLAAEKTYKRMFENGTGNVNAGTQQE